MPNSTAHEYPPGVKELLSRWHDLKSRTPQPDGAGGTIAAEITAVEAELDGTYPIWRDLIAADQGDADAVARLTDALDLRHSTIVVSAPGWTFPQEYEVSETIDEVMAKLIPDVNPTDPPDIRQTIMFHAWDEDTRKPGLRLYYNHQWIIGVREIRS